MSQSRASSSAARSRRRSAAAARRFCESAWRDALRSWNSGTLAVMPPYDCTDHVKPPNYQQHVRFANWLRAGICDDCVLARSTHLMYPALGTLTDNAYWEVAQLALTLEVWGNPGVSADFATADCAALFNPPAHEKQAVLDKWAPLILRLATMHADDMAALQAQQRKY